MKKVLILIASDFADDEVFIPQKLLHEKGVEVTLCSLKDKSVISSNGVTLNDLPLYKDQNLEEFHSLLIAGGLKAVKHYKEDWSFIESLLTKPEHLILCGVGSVPALIFAPLGLLDGKEATALPFLSQFGSFTDKLVCKSGDIITGKDKTSLFEFTNTLISSL